MLTVLQHLPTIFLSESTPGMFSSSLLAKSPRAEQTWFPQGQRARDGPHRTKQVPCNAKENWIVCLAFCSAVAHIWTMLSPLPRLRSQQPMVSATRKLHLGKLGDCTYINEKPIVYRYYLESGKGFSVSITSKLFLLRMHLKMQYQRGIEKS